MLSAWKPSTPDLPTSQNYTLLATGGPNRLDRGGVTKAVVRLALHSSRTNCQNGRKNDLNVKATAHFQNITSEYKH